MDGVETDRAKIGRVVEADDAVAIGVVDDDLVKLFREFDDRYGDDAVAVAVAVEVEEEDKEEEDIISMRFE